MELHESAPAVEAYIPPPFVDRKVEHEHDEAAVRSRVARLVERAQGGDQDAFGELYRLYHAPLFRLARFRLGREHADDVVAETFLRAWEALPRYRDTGAPFVSWLYGIARHVVADAGRAAGRAARLVELRAVLPERPEDCGGELDDRLVLAEALGRLPERQRQVIELKFLVGLTNHEVAGALGKSVGAVNVQQWRALANLRRIMET